MDEVKWAAGELALKEFEEMASDYQEYTPAFKYIGMMMVSYAIRERELFKSLFMQAHAEGQSFDHTIADFGGLVAAGMELIQQDYHITPEEAKILFEQMWVHTFGMGALCAMKVCDFTEDEVAKNAGSGVCRFDYDDQTGSAQLCDHKAG